MIRIMLHDDEDILLSYKKSKDMVKAFWEFSHEDCCGINVPYDQKEIWFCECHEEHHDDEQVCDSTEWIWEVSFCGMVVN